MNAPIRNKTAEIFDAVRQNYGCDDSLLQQSGALLFLAAYATHFGGDIGPQVTAFVDYVNEYEPGANAYHTLAGGYPSIGVVLAGLVSGGYLEEDPDVSSAITAIAAFSAELQLDLHNYDLLYGATGLVYYLLKFSGDSQVRKEALDAYVAQVDRDAVSLNGGLVIEDYYMRIREQRFGVNMGLAHGLPAVLKVLLEGLPFATGKTRDRSLRLITGICNFYRGTVLQDDSGVSAYGMYYIPDLPDRDRQSRLAWCYGDLGIGFTLYQAGVILGDASLADFAVVLMERTTHRRDAASTQIADAALCHGSAGVAHLYRKIHASTRRPLFDDAARFWQDHTLQAATYTDGSAGFKKYNPVSKQYETESGLLEGSAGIGLMLLSHLTGDCDWDQCLLFNTIQKA